jgi:hypothetical protein
VVFHIAAKNWIADCQLDPVETAIQFLAAMWNTTSASSKIG